MGGSGGYFSHSNPESLRRQLEQAVRQTDRTQYELECNRLLSSYLSNFNDRDADGIRRALDRIRRVLQADLEGTIDMIFGGSVSKHTYVDGLSDVDSLLLLDSCELAEATPDDAKAYVENRLAEEFGPDVVHAGTLAVTVRLEDAEIQLVPAVSCKGAMMIRDADTNRWSKIRPREFASALTEVNQANRMKVIPVIKLAKAIIAGLPERQRITSYHAESLAIEVFRAYQGPYELKPMLQHYFSAAADRVLTPIRDRSGQSVHVDDYLGEERTLARRLIADTFSRIARRMRNADAAGRLDDWARLFEGVPQ